MTKFETGQTYYCRSFCDYDCVFQFTVLKRTEKTVTIEDRFGKVVRRKIQTYSSEAETCLPAGNYSMAPTLSADKKLEAAEA